MAMEGSAHTTIHHLTVSIGPDQATLHRKRWSILRKANMFRLLEREQWIVYSDDLELIRQQEWEPSEVNTVQD